MRKAFLIACLLLLISQPVYAQDSPEDEGIRRMSGPEVFMGLPAEGLQPIEYDKSNHLGIEQPIKFDDLWKMGRIGLTVYQLVEQNDAWPFIVWFVIILAAASAVIALINNKKYEQL
jgi:hypothetical protein